MVRLYLVRHGHVGNAETQKRYNGQADVELSEQGISDMERITEILRDRPLKAIYATGLKRTIKGAEIIGRYHHNTSITIVRHLMERKIGRWEGLTFQEITEKYPEDIDAWKSDPLNFTPLGGESLQSLYKRVIPAFDRIVSSHNDDEVLIVGHGGTNRVILAHILGMDMSNIFRLEQDYGCLNVIDFFENNIPLLRLLNGLELPPGSAL